jgi:hypothetical protein
MAEIIIFALYLVMMTGYSRGRAMGMTLFFFFIFWTSFMVTSPLKYLDISANLTEMIKNFGMTIAAFVSNAL